MPKSELTKEIIEAPVDLSREQMKRREKMTERKKSSLRKSREATERSQVHQLSQSRRTTNFNGPEVDLSKLLPEKTQTLLSMLFWSSSSLLRSPRKRGAELGNPREMDPMLLRIWRCVRPSLAWLRTPSR